MDARPLLQQLLDRQHLSPEQAREFFDALMDGELDSAIVAAVLTALAAKGETVDELVAAAQALRARATPVRLPDGAAAIDTCGTGGDGQPLFNISTCVAIVAAAAGATVAKHGNRSNARPSGSAEVLAELGVNIEADVPVLERCLAECGLAFLYAARLHPAMRHAAPVRRALGVRTVFNLVGPLVNPAGVRRQVVGVNRPELVATVLDALRRLGAVRALVVHGCEGLCDLSTAGPSLVGWWDGQRAWVDQLDGAAAACCAPGRLEDLRVDSPAASARLIRAVLRGERGAARDIVVLNTAAALWVAGQAADFSEGADRALAALDSGAAERKLEHWAGLSTALPAA